jgi:very-short-patch-repair endonuclease
MDDKFRLFNRSEDKSKRQALRRDTPPAERLLWRHLRGQQLYGLRFRRQYGVGPYVLDFYCPSQRLAVEIDGDSHDSEEAQQYDAARTAFLGQCGIQVLRFTNMEVYQDTTGVAAQIAAFKTEAELT